MVCNSDLSACITGETKTYRIVASNDQGQIVQTIRLVPYNPVSVTVSQSRPNITQPGRVSHIFWSYPEEDHIIKLDSMSVGPSVHMFFIRSWWNLVYVGRGGWVMHNDILFSHISVFQGQCQGHGVRKLWNMAPRQIDRLRQSQRKRIKVSILWVLGRNGPGIFYFVLGAPTVGYLAKSARYRARKLEMTISPSWD